MLLRNCVLNVQLVQGLISVSYKIYYICNLYIVSVFHLSLNQLILDDWDYNILLHSISSKYKIAFIVQLHISKKNLKLTV